MYHFKKCEQTFFLQGKGEIRFPWFWTISSEHKQEKVVRFNVNETTIIFMHIKVKYYFHY